MHGICILIDKDCCEQPDILLTVNCATTNGSVELQWESPVGSFFGFCVNYECSTNANVDYCNGTEVEYIIILFNKANVAMNTSDYVQHNML